MLWTLLTFIHLYKYANIQALLIVQDVSLSSLHLFVYDYHCVTFLTATHFFLYYILYEDKVVNVNITANKSDSNESQSCYFFEPDLRHCLFIQAKFESFDF